MTLGDYFTPQNTRHTTPKNCRLQVNPTVQQGHCTPVRGTHGWKGGEIMLGGGKNKRRWQNHCKNKQRTKKNGQKTWDVPLRSGARREQRGQEQWVKSCWEKPDLLLINTAGWGGRGGGSSAIIKANTATAEGRRNRFFFKWKKQKKKKDRMTRKKQVVNDCVCNFNNNQLLAAIKVIKIASK